MKAKQASSSTAPPSQEFVVRVPKDVKKKYGVMKFNPNNKVDFTKCDGAKIERENNLRDYKAAHNLETMPQFGAGSEYGRDLREEARLKKLGINRKSYLVEDQPWKLKLGAGKATRHFKGTKEGGILENASYYIFTQCPDGAFEAFPVEEWHNFSPVIKYKHLSAEEAEEQFSKREQIMNYHSIMVQKRIRDDKLDVKEEEGEEKKAKTKKKGNDFLLTDLDDWAIMSDDSQGEGHDSDEEKPRPKGKGKSKLSKKSGDKRNSDDEAIEESDEEDEGREVDYMTDTDSEDDEMYADKDREATDKYQQKGVGDEDALKESDNEENEEEKNKEEDDEEEPVKDKEAGKGSDSESSSSSDSDSDPEKDGSFTSALFMPKKDAQEKKKKNKGDKDEKKLKGTKALKRKGSFSSEGSAASNSRSVTPTAITDPAIKIETSPLAKKSRSETSTPTPGAGNEGVSEETIRRYLMRKPMTTTDLVHKFKNCGLPREKLVTTVAEILKKINPEKNCIKDKLYLYLKH